jgi:hypothetical protein
VDDFYTTNPRFPATWGDPDLLSIFGDNQTSEANGSSPASTTSSLPSATISGSSNNSTINTNSSQSSNLAAIIGGAVGGVVALTILICIILWRVHLKRQFRKAFSVKEESPVTEKTFELLNEMDAERQIEIETNANRHEVANGNDLQQHELPGSDVGEGQLGSVHESSESTDHTR